MKKTVLITGGARGIGKELSLLFSSNNYNVIINYNKSKNEAEKLALSINSSGGTAIAKKADVSNIDEVKSMVNDAISQFGFIDLLINNAGVSKSGLLHNFSEDDYNYLFDINVRGVFNVTKEILPFMIREKKGNIINISSIWGICGASTEVLYSAAKAAVIGFTKALAKEVGPSNINVNCVAPGVIDTDMNKNLNDEEILMLKEETPLGTIGSTKDIANLALFLASEKSKFITGQVISPNGGFLI